MFSDDKLDMSNAEGLKRKLKTFFLPHTKFQFINDHYGLRPGKMHVLLAAAGKGKSTLARSILLDIAEKEPVLFYVTEESKEDLETQFAYNEISQRQVDNIFLVQESKDVGYELRNSVEKWLGYLRIKVKNSGAKVIFLDNITSSAVYNSVDAQREMILGLKELIEELDVAIFIICHAKKGIKNNEWFKEDDVKGSTQISITAHFFYAYNMFIVPGRGEGDAKHAFIRILKSRGYPNIAFSYDLQFNFNTYSYEGDKRVKTSDLERVAKASSKLL